MYKMATFDSLELITRATIFDQTKCYSTQNKRLFQMAHFIFYVKKYWESPKLRNSKINPSREHHAHFISCKPPHKTHPRKYFETTLWHSNHNISCWESQNLSVAFHLSTTVPTQSPVGLWNPKTPLGCALLHKVGVNHKQQMSHDQSVTVYIWKECAHLILIHMQLTFWGMIPKCVK